MKRIVFRLAVAILAFFVGITSTNFPSINRQTPNAFKVAGQSPSIPETKRQSQPLISDKLQKIGDLPAIGKYNFGYSLQFLNEQDGWLAVEEKLWRTQDGGKTWKIIFDGGFNRLFSGSSITQPKSIYEYQFINSQIGWLLQYGEMYRTEDGGITWTKIETSTEFSGMFFLDAQHGWAISKEGLFRINPKHLADSSEAAKQASSMDVDYYAHLKPKHREVLREWLKTKTHLRPAVEEIDDNIFQEQHKSDFESNLRFLRDSLGGNNYQYYSVGDMNRDGKEDFAVLLVDGRKQKDDDAHFALAIFNAPFKKADAPAYYEDGLTGISNCYIVFDRISKNHLFLGMLESDVLCATYYPKGKTYYFKDCME